MKSLQYYVIFIFTLLLLSAQGCEKKEKVSTCSCNNGSGYTEIINVEGIIKHDNNTDSWNIFFYEPNSFDNISIYIPCNLQDDYKKNNLQVLFSGKIYETLTDIVSPAGTEYKCLEIKSIKTL